MIDLPVKGHSEVVNFLKNEQENLDYKDSGMPSKCFEQRATADSFVQRFSFLGGAKYRVEMEVVKQLKEKPFVQISKKIDTVLRTNDHHLEKDALKS